MKKALILSTILCMLLCAAGCGSAKTEPVTATESPAAAPAATPAPTPAPTVEPVAETQTPQLQVSLYVPNENADGFDLLDTYIPELNKDELMSALIAAGVFPEGVAVNSCELTQDASGTPVMALDMNAAFAQLMNGTGTTGEYLYMGSLVNSFLNAFGASRLSLTVDGGVLETGHSIYDFELSWYDNY